MKRLRPLVLSLALALAFPAHAQQPAAPTPAAAQTASAAAPRGAREAPVPVPRPSEKAVRYHNSGNVLWVVGTVVGFLVPGLILFTGLSARMRDVARRVTGGRWYPTLVVYAALFALVSWVATLPLTYYQGFVREHAYGLSNQSFGKWLGDDVKSLGLGILSSALTLWIPYLLLRRSPRRWWLYTSIVAIPLVVLSIWLQPIYVDPLFNKFGPMKDRALEARILATAQRAGIEGGRVFEVAKSEDTEAVNAYVTGFGASKRIVLWDTLLRKMNEREVVFVMGHEMGHFILRHTLMILGAIAVLLLTSLYAVHALSGWLIGRFRHRFGFTEVGDIASYPLLVIVLAAVGFVMTPMIYTLTRHNEHEADRFGLELTRDNHAAASAFVKLQTENLAVPYPGTFYKIFRASHPPLGERIDFANTYRPWETGEPMRYADRFKR